MVKLLLEFEGIVSEVDLPKIISVDFYRQENGKEPVKDWLESLTKEERRAIGEDIKMVQEGWPLGMSLVRNIGKGLWEVRSSLPNAIARILFIIQEGRMLLVHGFISDGVKSSGPSGLGYKPPY